MTSAEINLAKELLDVFLDLFPMGSITKKVIKLPSIYLLNRFDNDTKTIENIVLAIAKEISEMPDQPNPGSASSASYDVVSILKESKLGPELLVQLNLDSDLVFLHLMATGTKIRQNASGLRWNFIEIGLRKLAEAIVECSPELPGVPLAFMQALLNRSKARDLLGQGPHEKGY